MSLIIFIMLVIATLSSWYFWNQKSTLTTTLHEYQSRLKRAKSIVDQKDQKIADLQNKIENLKVTCQQLESKYNKNLQQHATRILELEKRLEAGEQTQKRFNDTKEHLEEQVKVLNQQLKELSTENMNLVRERQTKAKNNDFEFKSKYFESLDQLKKVNKEFDEFKIKYKNIDPLMFFTLKKKCAEYSRLYNGMKSLKELSNAQNHNLETALTHLSRWTLERLGNNPTAISSFGELVGEALERTGGSLLTQAELQEEQSLPTKS